MNADTTPCFDAGPLENWVSGEMAAGRMAGCAVQVLRKGSTVMRGTFGVRSTDGDPVTPDTRFWIASMTKPVVSILAMRLVERDELSLLEPVANFIPGFGEAGVLGDDGETVPARRPVTVLDLMTHSSGLTYGQFGDGELHRRYASAKVYDYSATNAEIASRLAKLPLLHQPGTFFEYGMSTDVLGRVIEAVTGNPVGEVLETDVFAPLGMRDTSFEPGSGSLAELPLCNITRTTAPDFTSTPVWESAGAGLFSTVPDYCRFARMLAGRGELDGTRIIKPQTLDLMLKQHLPEGAGYGEFTPMLGITAPLPANGLGFGLGFAVRVRETAETPGGTGEFFWPGVSGCNFWVDPKNDLITVFLTHAPKHRREHRVGLRNAVYAGMDGGA